ARVRDTDLAAWAHQDLPFDRLVEELNPERSAARHPLFQVMLTLGEATTGTPQLAGLETVLAFADTAISKFDLTFSFTEQHTPDGRPAGIDLAIEYATDLYDAGTVQAVAGRLVRLIEAAAAEPATRIGDLDILTPDERAHLLDWGGTLPDTPPPGLVEQFAAQVARTPDAVALQHDEQSVTYGELSDWSNQLAHHLTSRGVTPGSLVAVHLERTPHLIAAVLAVLSAGAGYTLLDPQFPVDRLNTVLTQVDPSVLVTQTHMQHLDTQAVVVDLTRETPEISERPSTRPEIAARPDAIACVMFTSGSTGAPKGVAAPQRALAATFLGPDYLRFGPAQTYLQCSPMSWDAFALEVFGALLHGGTCVLQPGETTEPRYIAELVAHHGITTLQMSASLFNHMVDEHPTIFGHLEEVMTAGEAASPAHTARVLAAHPDLQVVNGYGPAESMGFSTAYSVPGTDAQAPVPIGRPIAGKQGYVLDTNLALVPPGVPGELYLGGDGLALGYIGRTDLTSERFVASPYGEPGSRLYRTGDLVRWNQQGELEYLGRADHQVKLRGFRIEPGEVEAVLLAADEVAQAAVVLREDRPGDKRLVAYAVPAEGRSVETEALRRLVAAALPEYMVPSAFVALKALPLTTNGKLDRAALPEPRYDSAAGGRAPRTPTEAMLCTLFAEVLGVPRVSIDDNFFHLGGHSFLASRLVSRIHEVWEVPITVRDLFQQPVVHALADGISTGMGENELDTVLPLRAARGAADTSAPLFCIHPISGMSWCYTGLLRHLDEDRPIIGLQARQLTAPHDAPRSMAAMADQYVAEIRALQPTGPYHLLGWSFGGLVAHAVAVRLEAAGESVGSLSLLDAYPLPEGFEPSPVTGRDVLIALLGTAGAELDLPGADGPPDTGALLKALREREPVLGMLDRAKAAAVVEATARNLAMRQRHEPAGRFTGPMLFFEAGRTSWPVTPQAAWAPYTSTAVEVHEIDCDHWEMTQAEPLGIVGKALAERLRD
ncbi:amino acid adenylation domain-containing protein, partial [Streptomyces sp. T-3]|nr:amino acid adenylation domain-containing protein [Streptomyces sp. T-3]